MLDIFFNKTIFPERERPTITTDDAEKCKTESKSSWSAQTEKSESSHKGLYRNSNASTWEVTVHNGEVVVYILLFLLLWLATVEAVEEIVLIDSR